MAFNFKDHLNRVPLIVAAIATYLSMLAFGLIAKVYKLTTRESLPALVIIGLIFYFLHELQFSMELKLSEGGISYYGKRSKSFKFKPETKTYRWDEVAAVALNNGLKIITINFTNGESIKFFAEPDKSQNFFDTIRLYCPDKVESQEEVTAYLRQISSMASEYDKSLFRGLSIGMPILFIGIALLLFFALFVAIKQTP